MKAFTVFQRLAIGLALAAGVLLATPSRGQSLSAAWEFTYDETEVGRQILFVAPLVTGSDGSVAFVVTRSNGAGGSQQTNIFWLRAKEDGSSPDAPLFTTGWQPATNFTEVVAVRRNHLIYSTGRELHSVTLDGMGTATDSIATTFTGAARGGDPLIYQTELARSPGFVFALATEEDKTGFTLQALSLNPAPPTISEVATRSAVVGNSIQISFRSQLGTNYRLETSTVLEALTWTPVGSVITGTGDTQTLSQPLDGTVRFYRVIAL